MDERNDYLIGEVTPAIVLQASKAGGCLWNTAQVRAMLEAVSKPIDDDMVSSARKVFMSTLYQGYDNRLDNDMRQALRSAGKARHCVFDAGSWVYGIEAEQTAIVVSLEDARYTVWIPGLKSRGFWHSDSRIRHATVDEVIAAKELL